MAATSKNIAAETVEVEDKIPHQTKVTSIKKDDEKVVFYGEDGDCDAELTLVEKAKRIVKNKRVIAGAASVVLLTAGVLVARKRNSEDEKDSETPAEA